MRSPCCQTLLGIRVKVGAELRERLQLTELRVRQLERASDLLHRLDLRVAADSGYRDARVYCRTDAGVEQLGLEEDLAVGDRNNVGRDIGRNVACLRLDDRERGQRAAVLDVRRALEQTGMQIEYIARISLASWRTVKQKGKCTVSYRVLGQVIVDNENVLALMHEILADRAACIRRDILQRRRLGCGRRNDAGVIHRTVLRERLGYLRNGRALLADRNIDTDNARALLIDDGVQADRGLAGLTVTDDQLALAAADRDHGVDRLDTGLERHVYRCALDDARGRALDRTGLCWY